MFELVRNTKMDEYEGQALYYVHKQTGMEVFHIKNKDTEKTCSFMFSTPSEDSKGVAHIIEHTVLCGSKRFPVKDPFSQVLLTSVNTFLNAITFCDKTMYPFSSPLEKDFDILFDIYSDAVFAPLLRKQSFYQEGVRSFEGKFDGVVFNEMCGARSTEDSVVQNNCTRELYKGTPYEYDSGGDPYYIADLTYEEYLERYKRWYSPSNCRLFLYGDIDTQKYLDRLEQHYLKDCKKGEKIIPKSELYMQKNAKPVISKAFCPAPDASSVVMTWLTTPSDDSLEVLTVSVLVDILLGNPGAPLYKAIVESGLGQDLNPQCGTDVDSPVLTFTAGFSHAKEGCEDRIEDFLMSQMKSYVKDGLDPELVEAAIRRQEFKIQEIPGDGLPFGIATCLRVARTWLRGGLPEDAASAIERLGKLKERVKQGRYFESWIQKNIIDNPRRCLLVVKSDSELDEKQKLALQEKFEYRKSQGLLPPMEDKIVFDQFLKTDDSEEALSTIKRITIKDLPKVKRQFDQRFFCLESKARIYDMRLFTRGIVYLTALFDTKGLDLEEKKLLPLLIRILQMCGTQDHDYSQIGTLIKKHTGSLFLYPNAGRTVSGKVVSNVVLKAKMLTSEVDNALNLIQEILQRSDLCDPLRLRAGLSDMITEFESGYTYSAHAYASMASSSVFSATAYEGELDMGTSLWLYLGSLKKDLEEGKRTYEELSRSLTSLRDKVFVQKAMTVQLGSDSKDECLNQKVSKFVETFPLGKGASLSSYYRDFEKPNEVGLPDKPFAYSVSSGPAFNSLAIRFDRSDEKMYVALVLLSSILSSGYLWNQVRSCNGAYGVECHVDGMENLLVFSSYRDPNVSLTFQTYLKALESEVSETEIEYAVVSILGKELKPLSPQSKCAEALKKVIYGKSYALYLRRRKILLSLTKQDLVSAARKLLDNLEGNMSAVVVCSKDECSRTAMAKVVSLPI